jgi:hypothetical protein
MSWVRIPSLTLKKLQVRALYPSVGGGLEECLLSYLKVSSTLGLGLCPTKAVDASVKS